MKDTMGLLFAYQKDEQMQTLTQKRALCSIPFGGRYRVVDFALSNMVNSGITKVGIVTRNNYQSLLDHLGSGKEWDLNRKNGGMFLLPPHSQSMDYGIDYRGKMEALQNAVNFIRKSDSKYVFLGNTDAIFNMNYEEALEMHIEKGADITTFYRKKKFVPTSGPETGAVYEIGRGGRVKDVAINPDPTGEMANLGMGHHIIGKDLLETLISECASHNLYSFHRDVLQRRVNDLKIFAYEYKGYYEKVDSVDAYFEANMDLLSEKVREELFQKQQIFTKIRDEAPTLYHDGASVKNSLIADGCNIEGTVENSIIFRGVHIRKGAVITNSIIMQDVEVQEKSELSYVIIDKDAVIRDGRRLFGYDKYPLVIGKGSVV